MQAPFIHRNVPPVLSLVLTLEPPGLQMRSLRHRDTYKEFAQSHIARDTAGVGTETQVVGPETTLAWPRHRVVLRAHFPGWAIGFGSVLVEREVILKLLVTVNIRCFLEKEGFRISMTLVFGGRGEKLCQVYFEPQ